MEGGEIDNRRKKVTRRKSSAYGFIAFIALILALMVYFSNPNNWFLALMLVILGIGMLISSR